ncbi:hypothetical protein UFOVP1247_51 [uncultured Caudovirales phage]|uniref:Uncharacterized protein n=1 Tax=uncultured Caudovirales phage TaxID=2100421 RepID=A0A6J5PVM4_9CAUD|nr:hypothetical protein UFOVP970_91 [uncultured Caudovirales phage]CAB4193284.1 hypothetical protein UFOVP1247_51 [uncultured Caudovirales phage]
MIRKPFSEWANDLEKEIKIDRDSIEFFHWTLEDEYESRLSEALEYFSGRPDYLRQECIEHLIELDQLETRFVEIEEYEKCAAIRDLRANLLIQYKEFI